MSAQRVLSIEDKLYRDRYKVDEEPHLWVKDPKMCVKCPFNLVCIRVCPTDVYKWEENKITITYDACVECGACHIACYNIGWKHPKGGFGISYKYG
jgi:ferredoxin like protein